MVEDETDNHNRQAKRLCPENDDTTPVMDVWTKLKSWIESFPGGFVHPCLKFDVGERKMIVTSDISTKQMLACIPQECILTKQRVLKEMKEEGYQLKEAVEDLNYPLKLISREDIFLSLSMAFMIQQHRSQSSFAPYFESLPNSESYNIIPRRWSESKLKELLGGTSLYDRVKDERMELKCAYDAIKNQMKGNAILQKIPPYSLFDDMYAALSSRGFAGLSSKSSDKDDAGDAMVPLLDLLDHKRGTQGKRDVRYNKATKQNIEDMVCVYADQELKEKSIICQTYGAKGNSQLLYRYGFCIPGNIEPDGSSNDILEFRINETISVELRAGPKSYTYGGFVKALEYFYDTSNENQVDSIMNGNDGEEDDMEAFLNQCDEDDDNYDVFDCYDDMPGSEQQDDVEENEEEMIQSECKALELFETKLSNVQNEYTLKNPEQYFIFSGQEKYYSAVLVQSEMRTLRLFEEAAKRIRCRLMNETKVDKFVSDDELLLDQVNQLVTAYFTIRHPDQPTCSDTK